MSYDINIYHYGNIVKRFENLNKRRATELYTRYSSDECIYTQLIQDGTPLNTYQAERALSITQRKRRMLAIALGRITQFAEMMEKEREERKTNEDNQDKYRQPVRHTPSRA